MRALCFALAISLVAAWPHSAPAQGTSSPELSLANSVVSRYCDAWSETDPVRREIAVAQVWSERGAYLDSQPVHVTGREALAAEMAKFQRQFPGAHFRCDAVRAHHGFVAYTWLMMAPDGTGLFRGMDFGEIDPTGRFVRIVSFFDMPQASVARP